jgi:membrane fusion protein, multidrug efflux system
MAEATVATGGVRLRVRPLLFGASAIAVAVVVGYWAVAVRGFERTDDAFVDGHLVFLSPRVSGQVVEISADENQHVKAGQVLVRLDPADFEVKVARAEADLDAARNRMAQSSAGTEAAAAQHRGAEAQLRHAEQEYARAQSLFESHVGSQTALDAATAARDAAAAEVRAAEQREQAERAALGNQAPVRQAEAALREANLAMEHSVVTAPFDGVIGKRSVEIGANVSPGQPLFALADDSGSWVSANFKETQIGRMKPGDPVEITADAFPGVSYRGHVESIAPATGAKYALLPPDNATGNFTKVVQRVPVRIALDGADGRGAAGGAKPWLPVGLSVNVRVRIR